MARCAVGEENRRDVFCKRHGSGWRLLMASARCADCRHRNERRGDRRFHLALRSLAVAAMSLRKTSGICVTDYAMLGVIRRLGAPIPAIVCLALAAGAQQNPRPPSSQTTFRAGVELVQIDVVVVDRNGKHIRGL